ncbi:MAG: S41 family peptidase [Planctomycetaceae bacterium]|nr:S41 family peptidase [Planctomycetales bacterium]MCB9925923.1 S41 family peptidase [Planctomycetaceae bacterium]
MSCRIAAWCLAFAVLMLHVRVGLTDQPPSAAEQERDDCADLLKLFVETFTEVERNYADAIDRRELMEAAIEGMLAKLDQHSGYIAPAELEEFRRGVDSEFGGIGVQVMMVDGRLTIVSPILDSPAYQAKLKAGDVITKVDGRSTQDLSLSEAVKLLKGRLGSSVELTVTGSEEDRPNTITLVRENVRLRTVRGGRRKQDDSWDYMYDHELGIAYVRITTFSRYTVRELRATMDELSARPLSGLILDLRSNPGGLLSSAIEVSDMFVEEGVIITTSGRDIETRSWHAHKAGTYTGFPMAVIVNRFSASASEIVAACLQDHGRAVVVGQQTWGKGTVQNVVGLEDGRSALKLTTAKYLRPSGKVIDRVKDDPGVSDWGVVPDEGLEFRLSDADAVRLERQRQTQDLIVQQPSADDVNSVEMEDRQFGIALEYMIAEVARARGERAIAESNP